MIKLDIRRIRKALQNFDLQTLFIEELGWDYADDVPLNIQLDVEIFALTAIAEKRGVVTLLLQGEDEIPDHATRRKIERKVAELYHEHIIIYIDSAYTQQIWQWVRREPGRPLASREHHYLPNQQGDSLIQKLQAIAFSLEEEETLTLVDVTGRVRAAFNVERATKRFYEQFKKERDAFAEFLSGIPDSEMERWYVSVMLNRLMFIYFIQKKGFLDNDLDYLRTKLAQSQQQGEDRYYQDFLCPLFFLGFAMPESQRSSETQSHLGRIPYLNGGIFQKHQVEQRFGETIEVPDAAFSRLFDFFDGYQWHLDDRSLHDDREINPDVLGYIFEKYINQKQMGAYYTQEDITGYISENTILPFLFDHVQTRCPEAFTGDDSVWALLPDNPNRYIYDAVRKGCDLPLPPEIAVGLDNVNQREDWNTCTPDDYALPTEIWRETVARRQRYEEVRAKLAAGEIVTINDFITYNLDLQQFAQDVIENIEDPALLAAFWRELNQVSILDPTCGSGAFLFAALNILEPLYEACLEQMAALVREWTAQGRAHRGYFKDFTGVLERVKQHPNRAYFVLKSIVINNLYGVDIMAEAVEIARLRLFLKLVSQVDHVENIEPLPDIDFNIQAGNTLVGFATYDEVKRAVYQDGAQMKLMLDDDPMTVIQQKAEDVSRLYRRFRELQTEHDMREYSQDFIETKAELRKRLRALDDELDRYLAKEYGVNPDLPADLHAWRESHQPFHWFVEFYGIMQHGGFDVIIGNPPYVVYSSRRSIYKVQGYSSEKSRNLYAFTFERSMKLLLRHCRLGLIIPVSFVSAGALKSLRRVVLESHSTLWLSNYANRPGQIFSGAQNRLSIVLLVKNVPENVIFSTRYYRWDAKGGEREALLNLLEYVYVQQLVKEPDFFFPKIGLDLGLDILNKIESVYTIEGYLVKSSAYQVYWVRVPGYFCQFLLEPPMARRESDNSSRIRGEVLSVSVVNEERQRLLHTILNSSVYNFWFCVYTDGRHINPSDVKSFPVYLEGFASDTVERLVKLSGELEGCMIANTSQWRKSGLLIDSVDSKPCKPIIDEIDRVLAQHYGFTDEELDFIINYDIKYRMGEELFEDEV